MIQAKWPATHGDAAELVTESSCDDDPRHLHVPLNHDLLDLVAKIWHGRHCFEPHLFAHSSGALLTLHLLERGVLAPQRLALIAPRANAVSALTAVAPRVGAGKRILYRTVAAYEHAQQESLDDYDGLRIAPHLGGVPALVVLDAADREVEPDTHGLALAHAWPGALVEVTDRGLGHLRILRDPQVVNTVCHFLERP